MENDDFSCLSEALRQTLPSLKIERWASFATLDLYRLVFMPNMTHADLKEIARRLSLLDLPMSVDRSKFDAYYQRLRGMTYAQVQHEEFLETPIAEFFGYRPRLLNILSRANIRSLRDLISHEFMEVYSLPGLGVNTMMELQGMMRKHGLSFRR